MTTSATDICRAQIRLILAVVVVVSATQAEARMYQWTNVSTGTVQLSGSPPAWYRSAASGPRIFVFDNGKLIDDTNVPVSEEHRERLRSTAFGQAEIANAPDPAIAPADELFDALKNASRDGIDVSAVTEAFAAEQREAESDEGMVEQTVAELKALLDAWDSRRLIEAQTLLQNAAGTAEKTSR